MAEHREGYDTQGNPYCLVCGLPEKDWISMGCTGKPVLSVAPPATLTEVERFNADPLAWIQEWNEKNGKVITYLTLGSYVVQLWVDDREGPPISTGVAPTLPHAFQNAIKGLDGLSLIG